MHEGHYVFAIANLDRRVGLRLGCHREETPLAVGKPLRNSTDSEPHPVRENPGKWPV